MGCVWSENEDCDRCRYCNRKAVNELIIINDVCQICTDITQRRRQETHPTQSTNGPFFGEYKCKACGRFWNSRLCWPNSYQVCKKCTRHVYPYKFRALHSSDMSNAHDTSKREHPKELCQKCIQLGHYCGVQKKITSNKTYSRPFQY